MSRGSHFYLGMFSVYVVSKRFVLILYFIMLLRGNLFSILKSWATLTLEPDFPTILVSNRGHSRVS